MRYCSKCVIPDTKPFIQLNEEGICNACLTHEAKKEFKEGIDWNDRKSQLFHLVERIKKKQAPFYDVLVPVSGGKDSIFQVHTALEYGLRVLAVNVDYGIKTEIGVENLKIIPKMGASLITFRPERKYHDRMIRIGFEDFGDPDLMSHALLYSYPLWTAIHFSVPLVFEGENTAFEYGGDKSSGLKSHIDRNWFYKYVVTKSITPDYISKKYNIPLDVLKVYDFPGKEMREKDIEAVFLSHFTRWDSNRNYEIAKRYGFQSLTDANEGTFRNFASVDEKINRIHQFMKVLKFGYGRATDHACEEIRNGRMSREEGIDIIKKYDIVPLSDFYANDFCETYEYTEEEFWSVMEKYCNRDVCRIKENKSLEVVGHKYLEGAHV